MQLSKLKFVQICLFASLFVTQAALANVVGSVIFTAGDVSVTHADNTVAQIEKNAALNTGDTLETRDGRVQFSLVDGGKVSLQPNSIFKINKYEFSGKEDGSEFAFMELVKGGLRTITGLIGHKNRERYQLKTTVATIGIRGTEFTVNFNDNQFLMTTNHGSVDVCGNSGNCLNAVTGQSIAVSAGGAPKFSSKAAVAAAAAPESSKPVFTSSDAIAPDASSGIPAGIPNAIQQPAAIVVANQQAAAANAVANQQAAAANLAASQALANINQGKIMVASLMNTSCNCGINQVFQANVITNNLSQPTDITTATQSINLTSFSSYNSDGIVAWGRASSGNFSAVPSTGPITWQDYIIGSTPSPGQLNNLIGTYSVFASTAPMQIDGSGISSPVGAQNSTTGNFTFNFGLGTYGYNLHVLTSSDGFSLSNGAIPLTGLNKNNPTFAAGGTVTSDLLRCSTGLCTPAIQTQSINNLVQGGFFGQRGERVGIQYGFNAPGGAIYGSAVLK